LVKELLEDFDELFKVEQLGSAVKITEKIITKRNKFLRIDLIIV